MNTSFYNLTHYEFNSANVNHTELLFDYSLWQKIIFSIFMIPIIFFSIAGNALVILAISKYSYLKITNNIFLASLAVADLFVTILAMSLNALQILSGHWYLKSFMCRFWFFCDVLFSTASILHLFCVSFDRYLSISDEYTFQYRAEDPFKSWRIRIMISSAWLVSAALGSVMFTNLFTDEAHGAQIDQLDHFSGKCEFKVNLAYRFLSCCISFWIPAIGMVIFYTLVMKKANKLEKNKFKIYNSLHSSNHKNSNVSTSSTHIGIIRNHMRNSSARSSGDHTTWKREYKALKTLGTVIGVFLICWAPYTLTYTFCFETSWVCPKKIAESVLIQDIVFWIGYFNSMINPFLYNFTNQDFRKAFQDLLHLKKVKKRRQRDDAESAISNQTIKKRLTETIIN